MGFVEHQQQSLLQKGDHHVSATVVLVHGAFADASSYGDVIPDCWTTGCRSWRRQCPTGRSTVMPPSVGALLASIPGPVVLVGHSYGCAVATVAGTANNVEHPGLSRGVRPGRGRERSAELRERSRDSELASALVATPIPGGADLTVPSTGSPRSSPPTSTRGGASWPSPSDRCRRPRSRRRPVRPPGSTKPAWGMVASADHTINPDVQRFATERANVATHRGRVLAPRDACPSRRSLSTSSRRPSWPSPMTSRPRGSIYRLPHHPSVRSHPTLHPSCSRSCHRSSLASASRAGRQHPSLPSCRLQAGDRQPRRPGRPPGLGHTQADHRAGPRRLGRLVRMERPVEALRAEGFEAIAIANPLRGLTSDAAYVRSVLETIEARSSWWPTPTAAPSSAAPPPACPTSRRSSTSPRSSRRGRAGRPAQPAQPRQPGHRGHLERPPLPTGTDGGAGIYMRPEIFRQAFAADLPTSTTRLMRTTQRPLFTALLRDSSGPAAWRTIPSWYLLATQDRTIPPATQAFMAARAGATVVSVRPPTSPCCPGPGRPPS